MDDSKVVKRCGLCGEEERMEPHRVICSKCFAWHTRNYPQDDTRETLPEKKLTVADVDRNRRMRYT